MVELQTRDAGDPDSIPGLATYFSLYLYRNSSFPTTELKQFSMFPNMDLLLSDKDNVYKVIIFNLTLFKEFVLKVKDWPVLLLYSIIAKFYIYI